MKTIFLEFMERKISSLLPKAYSPQQLPYSPQDSNIPVVNGVIFSVKQNITSIHYETEIS
jgi:hypothetical protein